MSRANEGARQGLINKLARGKRMSSTKGDNKGKPHTYRSACPECPIRATAENPDGMTYVQVGANSKSATCKHGHTFNIGRSPGRGPRSIAAQPVTAT